MPVLSPRLLLEDEHYAARGHFQTIERAYGGDWPQASAPLRLNGEQLPLRMPAPLLGEHNDYVLRELLGYDDAHIEALNANGTIGRQPAWREGERD
jgi:formyl-CoA transferase